MTVRRHVTILIHLADKGVQNEIMFINVKPYMNKGSELHSFN